MFEWQCHMLCQNKRCLLNILAVSEFSFHIIDLVVPTRATITTVQIHEHVVYLSIYILLSYGNMAKQFELKASNR